MSKTEGEVLTCDVCGESVFLKYTGDRKTDGGYTRWREYQKPPEGWNEARVRGIGDICPLCSERINRAIKTAITRVRGMDKEETE